jgi:hypothetical protein
MAETIALIAAATALCSVLLGPLVSMWVVQKQARVSVLSGNRQAWINTLRDQVSEFLAILAVAHAGEWSSRTEKEYDEELKRLVLVGSKIKLMLNPKEEDHERLSDLLTEAFHTLGGRANTTEGKDAKRGAQLTGEIVPLAQSILKREWVRVKLTE